MASPYFVKLTDALDLPPLFEGIVGPLEDVLDTRLPRRSG